MVHTRVNRGCADKRAGKGSEVVAKMDGVDYGAYQG